MSLSQYNGKTVRGTAKALLGVLLFLGLDGAVFRSGWYGQWVEPNSSAGAVQLTLLRARQHQREWKEPLVLTLGDSRMNYSAKLANEYAAAQGMQFRLTHGGVAGSNPRVWHYLLRELDPDGKRYRAVVIPVDSFEDEDTFIDFRDYPLDVNYLSLLLGWRDCWEYPRSYATWQYAREAWKACLFKGAALQADLLAMLAAPRQRVESARVNRDWWPNGSYEFLEEEKNVVGLKVDWATRQATIPPGVDPEVVKTVLLRGEVPQTGRYGEYRRHWLGKIVERYRGSGTTVVFVMLPRGPVVRPPVKTVSASVRELGKQPGVKLGEEHRYEELERPEYFRDPLHMNRAGATRYGEMLVDELARLLGAV